MSVKKVVDINVWWCGFLVICIFELGEFLDVFFNLKVWLLFVWLVGVKILGVFLV